MGVTGDRRCLSPDSFPGNPDFLPHRTTQPPPFLKPMSYPDLTAKPGYKPQADDTSIETDLFEFALLRQRSNSDRFLMAMRLIKGARSLSFTCLRQQFSSLPDHLFAQKLAQAWLQEHYPKNFTPRGNEMTWIQDSTSLALLLHQILTNLEIPYYVTGGMAAIAYGEPRTTLDVDLVLAIARQDIDRLVSHLEQNGFYVPGVEDVKTGRMRTLSVTHIETISRADLVISGSEAFDQAKFTRRRLFQLSGGAVYFASPEDVVLNKLRWRRQSQSEKQWRDVLGVLKVQGETLDFSYLFHWAEQLDLIPDLTQAMTEAGLSISG